MLDRLPPLQTLRAFEAAGRLLSMTLAAGELHVTHGAVSRHVQTLERHLGVLLFRPRARRIVLTDQGAEFLAVVRRVLVDLSREAERLRGNTGVTRLSVSTSVSFASKWLAPRLHRLKALHPEFDVHLDVTDLNVDLNASQFDAAIRYGVGRYRHAEAERLMDETVTPVCSPAYLAGMGEAPTMASLAGCTLLHEDRMLPDWERFFAAAGVEGTRGRQNPAYSHASMAIEAAIRGEGVVLGRSALVAEDIATGRLVAPFPGVRLGAERGYDLVYRPGNREHPKVCALREWLAEEIRLFAG